MMDHIREAQASGLQGAIDMAKKQAESYEVLANEAKEPRIFRAKRDAMLDYAADLEAVLKAGI